MILLVLFMKNINHVIKYAVFFLVVFCSFDQLVFFVLLLCFFCFFLVDLLTCSCDAFVSRQFVCIDLFCILVHSFFRLVFISLEKKIRRVAGEVPSWSVRRAADQRTRACVE